MSAPSATALSSPASTPTRRGRGGHHSPSAPRRRSSSRSLPSSTAIYVWKFDRFGRTAVEMLTVAAQLREMGCVVVSLTEASIEDASPDGNFMRGISALIAERETQIKSDRGKLGASGMFRAGRYNGPAPLGYRFADGRLLVVQHEAAIVRRIFAEFTGGRNLSAIARGLNAESIPTKRGGKWRQGTIGALRWDRGPRALRPRDPQARRPMPPPLSPPAPGGRARRLRLRSVPRLPDPAYHR